jgi:hypothetical protein
MQCINVHQLVLSRVMTVIVCDVLSQLDPEEAVWCFKVESFLNRVGGVGTALKGGREWKRRTMQIGAWRRRWEC